MDRISGRGGRWLALGLALGIVLVAVVAALFVTGRIAGSGPCGSIARSGCTRVLFLGNSYTSVNDLPRVFAELAASGGQPVTTGAVAPGGATLADQVASAETRDVLGSAAWDVVILQEQSQIPAAPGSRTSGMTPAARVLVDRIWAMRARPILLETWAHRDGWPEMGLPDAISMEAALLNGYLAVGHALHIPVAPVGEAWRAVSLSAPELDLWQADGSHPTVAGTYLAACVLFASIFDRSPEGLGYVAGLPDETARQLQSAAARVVLGDPGRWLAP
jgi:hypothetical protein